MIADDPAPKYFLTTYTPLVATKDGRVASEKHGIPPFVDGSIRREPDLEHAVPSISCLCRAGKFAPRFQVGDIVGYMTCKGRYGESQDWYPPADKPPKEPSANPFQCCDAPFPGASSGNSPAPWQCHNGMPSRDLRADGS